jgi:hypothetical protein
LSAAPENSSVVDTFDRRLSLQVDSYFVMGDLLVPPAQRLPGGFLDDGLLVVVSGKGPDCIQAGKACNGGEHHLLAVFAAQEAGAAETGNCPKIVSDLDS